MTSDKLTHEQIDKALKKGKVFFSWKGEHQWQFYAYKRKNYYYVRADGEGRIETCATLTWDRFVSHIGSQITPPQKSDLEIPKGFFKEEVMSKIGLTKKKYLELYHKGGITGGGGITTELSFSKSSSGDMKADEEFVERVLNPKSAGYFSFNF